jgi:uncharacterized protein (DUF433 family)
MRFGAGRKGPAAQNDRRHHIEGGPVREYREMVVSNPGVMMGKPVIAGTRITVELILEKLAAGETVEQVLEAHPRLNEEAVRAALAFAADALRADVVYPLEASLR